MRFISLAATAALTFVSAVASASNSGVVRLLDPAGIADVRYYDALAGDTQLVLEVTDADLSGTIEVLVSTALSGDVELLTLTETGVGTGVFRVTVPLDVGVLMVDDNGRLEVEHGDLIEVEYDDASDAFGNPKVFLDQAYFVTGATSGELTADTTWTAGASPYLVTGDVRVPLGMKLTIAAGTEVLVMPSDRHDLGGDTTRVEFFVKGTLETQGTNADPVILRSASLIPNRGDWYGFRPGGRTATVTLAGTMVSDANIIFNADGGIG